MKAEGECGQSRTQAAIECIGNPVRCSHGGHQVVQGQPIGLSVLLHFGEAITLLINNEPAKRSYTREKVQ
jgi:hypothetical protein